MIERLPTRPRLALVSTQSVAQGKGAADAALAALTLVASGRPQMAVALLERLPELIAAEIDAALIGIADAEIVTETTLQAKLWRNAETAARQMNAAGNTPACGRSQPELGP